jgi:hypothetical protein
MENQQAADLAPTAPPVEEMPAHTYKADLKSRPGWMLLEVNLSEVAKSREEMWKFMGFMDDHKGIGLGLMVNMRQQAEQIRTAALQAQNKGLFRNFIKRH